VRASVFRAPVRQNIVDALIEHGYDVAGELARRHRFSAARLDARPGSARSSPGGEKVVEETGHEKIKAIIHCQGSTSFTVCHCRIGAAAGGHVVSNAVSRCTMVLRWSGFKLRYARVPLKVLTDYLNPQWGIQAHDAYGEIHHQPGEPQPSRMR
jgi:hypothetical protein